MGWQTTMLQIGAATVILAFYSPSADQERILKNSWSNTSPIIIGPISVQNLLAQEFHNSNSELPAGILERKNNALSSIEFFIIDRGPTAGSIPQSRKLEIVYLPTSKKARRKDQLLTSWQFKKVIITEVNLIERSTSDPTIVGKCITMRLFFLVGCEKKTRILPLETSVRWYFSGECQWFSTRRPSGYRMKDVMLFRPVKIQN